MLNKQLKESVVIAFPLDRITRAKGAYATSAEIIILPVIRYEYDAPMPVKKRRIKA
jgi:hypothetical protein